MGRGALTLYTVHTVIRVTVLLTCDDFPLLTTWGLGDPADNNTPQFPDKAGCSLRAVPQPLHTNQPVSNLSAVLPQTLLISRVRVYPQCTPRRAEAVREGRGRTHAPAWAPELGPWLIALWRYGVPTQGFQGRVCVPYRAATTLLPYEGCIAW